MKLKRTAAALLAAALMASVPFYAFADEEEYEDQEYADTANEASEIITDSTGKYNYSLNDDGNAVIEAYNVYDEPSVVMPEELDGIKVTELGSYAYYDHKEITELTLSKNFEEYYMFSFYGCRSLKEFKVDKDNPTYYADEQGILFDKTDATVVSYPAAKEDEEYNIPDGIIAIGHSAFACNPYLKKVTIPEGVLSDHLGIWLFAECEALETVVLPESLTAIPEFCFSGCHSLKNVNLTDSLESIGNAAFFDCTSLEEPEFPSSLTEIGQGAYVKTGFDHVTIPPNVKFINYSAFGFTTDEQDNIVPLSDFTIYGYENTYAQSYCSENEISFVALSEDEEDGDQVVSNNEKKSSDDKNVVKRNRTIAAFIIIAVLVVVVLIVSVFLKGKNGSRAHDSETDDEEEPDRDGSEENIDDSELDSMDGSDDKSEGDGEA